LHRLGQDLAPGKAVAAINWSAFCRPEGDLGFGAALGTDSGMHFPIGPFTPPAGTALGATARLVGEPLFGIEFLFPCREDELCSAIAAAQGFVGKNHQ